MTGYLEYKNKPRIFSPHFSTFISLFIWVFTFLGIAGTVKSIDLFPKSFTNGFDSVIAAVFLIIFALPLPYYFYALSGIAGFGSDFVNQLGRQLTCQKYLVSSGGNTHIAYYNILNFFYWAPEETFQSRGKFSYTHNALYELDLGIFEIYAAEKLKEIYPMYEISLLNNVLVSKIFLEDVIRINKFYRSRFKFIAGMKRSFIWVRIILRLFGIKYFDNKELLNYQVYKDVMVSRYSQFGLTPELIDFIVSERSKLQ